MSRHNQSFSDWSNTRNDNYHDHSNLDETDEVYSPIAGSIHHDHQIVESHNQPQYDVHYTEPDSSEFGSDSASDYGHYEDTDPEYLPNTDSIQIRPTDFIDSRSKSGSLPLSKIATVIAAVMIIPALGIAIIHSSQPDMSAREIVQLESYEGLQTRPTFFNMADLNGCGNQSDCIKQSRASNKADIDKMSQQREASATLATAAELPTEDQSLATALPQPEVATANTQTATVENSGSTIPPRMVVQKQWSIIRSTPQANGSIVTSLAKGTVVDIIASNGDWFEIEAINQSAPRGYMHKSTIAANL